MNPPVHIVSREHGNGNSRYRSLPLHELLRLIVEDSDPNALIEFHDHRTLFSHLEETELLLADFADRLRQAAEAQCWGSSSLYAYDLLIDRFSRMPRSGESGIDCRKYFRAALNLFTEQPETDELRGELMLAEILQRLVYRHFELALKEAQRNADMTRFEWTLPTGSVCLFLPRSLPGAARRRWLEEHVADPSPRRPGERDRIQMIIQQHFQGGGTVSFDDTILPESALHPSDLPGFFDASISISGLAATVAQEKADRLLEQRPAIQRLGSVTLKTMILRVFDDIATGDFREGAIAREFGLDQAAVTRFCGSHWNSHLPDLWRNAGQILAQRKEFVEIIRELGIRPRPAVLESLPEGRFCK